MYFFFLRAFKQCSAYCGYFYISRFATNIFAGKAYCYFHYIADGGGGISLLSGGVNTSIYTEHIMSATGMRRRKQAGWTICILG